MIKVKLTNVDYTLYPLVFAGCIFTIKKSENKITGILRAEINL